MARFEEFSPEDVRDYILEEIPQIEKDVLEKIVLHKIDGETFLVLTDAYLREIAPLLGDRLKMKKLIVKLQVVEEPLVSFYICIRACLWFVLICISEIWRATLNSHVLHYWYALNSNLSNGFPLLNQAHA